jgi:serine/threonine-protein phosphatase 2B catalytic subunit
LHSLISYSRKSDIENERLPPELIDVSLKRPKLFPLHVVADLSQPDEEKPASPMQSVPHTPSEPGSPLMESPLARAGAVIGQTAPSGSAGGDSPVGSPGSPSSPNVSGMTWRRGHSRQASLGTSNNSSPSNRRRSLDKTMHLIRDVVKGEDAKGDGAELSMLAEEISSPTRPKPDHGLA